MEPYSKSKFLRWATFLMVSCMAIGPLIALALELGPITFANPPATPLINNMPLKRGLTSIRFVGKVGGVAFGGIAAGSGDYKNSKIVDMKYDTDQSDGNRLAVTLLSQGGKKQVVRAAIYDWQLIPIAKFANSMQDALFTLFGELRNKDDETVRLNRGQRVLNYHPDMANTLLGLRLFQADVLILDDFGCCDLPKENGQYLLGAGEDKPIIENNYSKFVELKKFLQTLELRHGQFRSYVISDKDRPVRFSVKDGQLVLSGDPVWYCWRYRLTNANDIDALEEAINEKAIHILEEQYEKDSQLLSQKELSKKYDKKSVIARANAIHEQLLSETLLESMREFSTLLSKEVKRLSGVNPAVYSSITNTMRFAAFFRLAKKQMPEAYRRFVASLDGVSLSPKVETPTVMIPPPVEQ